MTELGQRLKEARLENNYTMEELQEITKIQKRYLQALEEGDYSVLPGAFYARAFTKNYAEAVGLDPEELFEQYSQDLPASNEQQTDFVPRASRTNSNVPKENKLLKVFPFVLTILLLGAVLVGLYWLITNNSDDTAQEPNKDVVENFESTAGEEQPEDQANSDKVADGEKKESPDKETESEPEVKEKKPEQKLEQISLEGKVATYKLSNTEEFKVEIQTKGNVYIDVKNNNGEYVAPGPKTFQKGETLTYTLTDQPKATFNIGASQNVHMTINGKPFKFPVEPSERPHQIIVIENDKSAKESTQS
ncbi:helix-turn-helix domain-containing protein [Pseudalkalibacillus decolorationis]|uniref:helix-turn-helix domain-containing protein n=1 Tax=Pseudalkalibacillus decolorationis TaxID=163879 RepID=UPI002148D2C9|nr:RodZ domain-containing protein [Pseudalkalibacillus decolorationis]